MTCICMTEIQALLAIFDAICRNCKQHSGTPIGKRRKRFRSPALQDRYSPFRVSVGPDSIVPVDQTPGVSIGLLTIPCPSHLSHQSLPLREVLWFTSTPYIHLICSSLTQRSLILARNFQLSFLHYPYVYVGNLIHLQTD